MLKRYGLLITLLLVLSIAGLTQAEIQTTQYTLIHDDIERTYHVYEPPQDAHRILIALHDFASSGRAMEIVTGLDAVADDYGFIVVYPDAAGYYWDDGRIEYGITPDDGSVDDLGFLAALRDELIATYAVNPAEIYLTGIGNGGHMAYSAACLQSEFYGGIIVVSSLLWDYHPAHCLKEANPSLINLLILHGSRDEFYLRENHQVDTRSGQHLVMGTSDTLSFFGRRNTCEDDSLTTLQDTIITLYSDCAATTALVEIEGSGGQWHRTGDYRLNQFSVDASAIIGAFISGADWQALTAQDEVSEETPRTFRLFVPNSYDQTTPTPLVIGLHGKGGNANHQAWISDFNTIAEREGFITIYPNGIENQWNYIRGVPEGFSGLGDYDDNEFLATLLADLAQDLNIDTNRIYVMGYSNGGFMTQYMACAQQERYAAFASVAATGTYALPVFCHEKGAVPMMYNHGTEDAIVPWAGQQAQDANGTPFYISFPMSQTMSFWAFHNGCNTDDLDIQDLPQTNDAIQSRLVRVLGCPEYAPVQLYMVVGGGHVWHGVRENDNPMLGISTNDFNASEVIWQFFEQHSLDERP
jgi:polyhydroxybutyrate depolymerase